MPLRPIQPGDQGGVDRCTRRGVFANRAAAVIRDEQVRSRHGNAVRVFNPETREALTVAPDVVYSPIVPL